MNYNLIIIDYFWKLLLYSSNLIAFIIIKKQVSLESIKIQIIHYFTFNHLIYINFIIIHYLLINHYFIIIIIINIIIISAFHNSHFFFKQVYHHYFYFFLLAFLNQLIHFLQDLNRFKDLFYVPEINSIYAKSYCYYKSNNFDLYSTFKINHFNY